MEPPPLNESQSSNTTADSSFVKDKEVQSIDTSETNKASSLFWHAVNSGVPVDKALKQMASEMKGLGRIDEAIQTIRTYQDLCSPDSMESVDNVLIELCKSGGKIDEQIEVLERKLKTTEEEGSTYQDLCSPESMESDNVLIELCKSGGKIDEVLEHKQKTIEEEGSAFGWNRKKILKSLGKGFRVTTEQYKSRLLGILAQLYMQKENYHMAEKLYREALSIEPADKKKQCNLAICLMKCGRIPEAKSLLHQAVVDPSSEEHGISNSYSSAMAMLTEVESQSASKPVGSSIKRDPPPPLPPGIICNINPMISPYDDFDKELYSRLNPVFKDLEMVPMMKGKKGKPRRDSEHHPSALADDKDSSSA